MLNNECIGSPDEARKQGDRLLAQYGHYVMGSQAKSQIHDEYINVQYTVGLADQGLPELIVFCLPPDVGLNVLNKAADLLKRGELPLNALVGDLCNVDLIVKQVQYPAAEAHRFMRFATEQAPAPFPVYQIVLPNVAGKFPWQLAPAERAASYQPVLYQDYEQ